MTMETPTPPSRRDLLKRSGILAVVSPRKGQTQTDAPPEDTLDIYVCITAEGRVIAFCGHVDLGTGVRTALAQIIAEELDFPFAAVELVLGDTLDTPDQGPTIASETIQVTAQPLRIAAAQSRQHLIALAAEALRCAAAELKITAGNLRRQSDAVPAITLETLLGNRRILLPLADDTTLKPVDEHQLIGQSVKRVDIPAKVSGQYVYVHDVRAPGMLHGRVVRPPYSGFDSGEFIGRSLEAVDRTSIDGDSRHPHGGRRGRFRRHRRRTRGICCRGGAQTQSEMEGVADGIRLSTTSLAHFVLTRRRNGAWSIKAMSMLRSAAAKTRLDRSYVWPYQMHASIGPSCAVADATGEQITVWSGTQNPYALRDDLALLTGLLPDRIDIIRLEAAGCYGRNCADDVSADAVLLSRAAGAPVRVQLTREQEHLWEPKGAAQVMDVAGALGDNSTLAAYDFQTRYPSNAAPTLALLLTGRWRRSPQPC